MSRFAPRIGVSLLVTLLFVPLSSTAHDSDDKSFAVVVAGHITWTGEDHRDCVDRATATGGQCVPLQRKESVSNEYYCPEVTPGFPVQCYRSEDDHRR